MNEIERKAKARELFDALQPTMLNLYIRWLDEREHEDINDYSVGIKRHLGEIGGEFVKMNKRPFGFTYKLADATYQIMVRPSNYEYKRIA